MPSVVRRTALALTAAVAVVPLLTSAASAGTPKIDWGSCGDDPALKPFQCASVEVPTDYDRPDGPTTTIALTRLPATGTKIGTLFTNPGGPGGPGVEFVQQNALHAYSEQVRARFDILGFDPRGVGKSDPATCFETKAEEDAFFADQPAFPVSRQEERQATLDSLRLGVQCTTTSPGRFQHMSTANVARDMDLLRQAVGDDKLSYVGYSYGTYLGATYAKLFPDNVRALVLDGTMYPDWYAGSDGDRRPLGARIRQGEGGSQVLAEFNRQCKAAGPSRCSLAKLGDPATVVEQTFQRLKTRPAKLVLPDGTTITVGYQQAVATTFFSLYAPAGYPGLADLLTQLATATEQPAGRSSVRLAAGALPADALDQLRRGDDYASVGTGLQPCVETRQTGRPLAYPRYADAEDRRAPHFGRLRTWVGQMCEFLPLRDTDAYRGPWQQSTKEPVLVIGTRFDPATPYQATRPYADLFPAARMLTIEGWGHTTIGVSRCADALITRYLVDRAAPPDNSTCGQDRKPFDPLPDTARARLRLS